MLAAVVFLAQVASAKPNLKKELGGIYRNRVLPLKSTCSSAVLYFDAHGQGSPSCPEEPWIIFSSFRFRKFEVSKEALTVTGIREIDTVVAVSPTANPTASPNLPLSDQVVLTFYLSAPLTEIGAAQALIAPAFVSEPERTEQLLPYSRLVPSKNPLEHRTNGNPTVCDPEKQKPLGLLGADRPVYSLTLGCPGELPPKAIRQPDPGYPEDGRRNGIRGDSALHLIVDDKGRPVLMRVFQRLGHGFEESAINTVASWTFQPATRDGKPMAVVITVEVSFH